MERGEEKASRKTVPENSQDDEKGEQGEESSGLLPEELVERILAMVPFPFVFKARLLSKSWLARLSPISSQEDEREKCRAIAFQKQIAEWSTNWKTFFPVSVRNDDLIGYDGASHAWRRLPSHSFLPMNVYKPCLILQKRFRNARARPPRRRHHGLRWRQQRVLQMGGALLLVTAWEHNERVENNAFTLCVANILTRSWKQLPPRPNREPGQVSYTRLLCQVREAYKVIVVSFQGMGQYHPRLVQIYDSERAGWKVLNISEHFDERTGLSAFQTRALDYSLRDGWARTTLQTLAIDVKEETLEELDLSLADPNRTRDVYGAFPIICTGGLVIIMPPGLPTLLHSVSKVLKVDLSSRRLLEGSRVPAGHLEVGKITPDPYSDCDCIFLGVEHDHHLMTLAYNVDNCRVPASRTLDRLADRAGENYHGIHSPFQPGWNPFVAV